MNPTVIKIIGGIAVVAVMVSGFFYIKHLRSENAMMEKERDTAVASLRQCEQDQDLTYEVSDEYQKNIAALERRVADLKRLRQPQCIVPRSEGTGGPDAATAGTVHAGQNGISTGYLLDFAAEAEGYRQQVIGLQNFIRRTQEPARQ